jgi:GxxExxY protein
MQESRRMETRLSECGLELAELTERIIGAAIEVHRRLGPGFIERIYEKALAAELRKRKVAFERQYELTIWYDDEAVGVHILDLFVETEIVVELKAVKAVLPEHFAFVRSYLKAVGRRHGLLLNFAKPKLEVKRVYCP